jgi:MtN3 and saliva related transmembrane protein
MNPELVGFIAGLLTTICFIPQAIAALRAPDTKSISLIMYIVFSVGVSCWLIYGILLNSPPVIIANSITLPIALIILAKKIHNLKTGKDK